MFQQNKVTKDYNNRVLNSQGSKYPLLHVAIGNLYLDFRHSNAIRIHIVVIPESAVGFSRITHKGALICHLTY